ncbi:MAG: glycosyltransferase [Pseudomonadota bacterium]
MTRVDEQKSSTAQSVEQALELVIPESVGLGTSAMSAQKPLRVLHVYRTYFPDTQGGLEEVIRQISMNTQRLGIESRVFALSDNPGDRALDLREGTIFRSKKTFEIASCGVSFGALRTFRDQVDWADIVHYHFPWPFADVLHFGARVKKPTLLTYHSDIVRQKLLGRFYAPLMHRFLRSVDRIVCTSANYFATSDVLTKYSDKVEVVPIGINQSTYEQPLSTDIDAVEEVYGRDFFLFVGVLRYYKGLHILLDSIRNAPYEVVIAGSGPTENELLRQAKASDVKNVHFAGHVSNAEKNALFALCRGVVFPSYLRAEAFGVTLLEGAMFAKPLISTEVGSGTSHVNVHNETGYVVPPGSAKALRKAMDKLWQDAQLAERLGQGARQRYERLFTGKLMGERYADIYRHLG